MSPSRNPPEILTTYPRSGLLKKSAAVDFLGVSTRTFERYVMRRVPRIRVGGQYLYPEEGLRAWIAANRVEPQPGPRRGVTRSPAPEPSCARAKEILKDLLGSEEVL